MLTPSTHMTHTDPGDGAPIPHLVGPHIPSLQPAAAPRKDSAHHSLLLHPNSIILHVAARGGLSTDSPLYLLIASQSALAVRFRQPGNAANQETSGASP